MQLEQNETFTIQGPQLEILGEVESKLPAPARKRPTAALLLVVLAMVSVFGIGGAKMKGQQAKVQKLYTATDRYGNGIQGDMESQVDAAASLIRKSKMVLEENSDPVVQAEAALAAWNSRAVGSPSLDNTINRALYQSVTELYNAAAYKADQETKRQLDGLFQQFTSAQATIERAAAQTYNPAAENYNRMASAFPANVIGGLWGCGRVEPFTGMETFGGV